MPQTIEQLRTFQWGREGTRGTAVAATSKMAVVDVEFSPLDKVDRPKLKKGLLHRNPGSETIISRGTAFRIPETPVIYDQIQNYLLASIKGAVAPTGTNPYTWTVARLLTADPNPDTFTLERRMSDGTTPIDNEWAYAFLTQIHFSYQVDQPLRFSADGICRRIQGSTLTPALAMPTIEIPPTPLAKMWIDSTWANLGVTQVVAQVLRATVTYHTGLVPKPTFDGRSDLDFTTYVFDASACGVDAEITVMAGAQYAIEKTAAEAQTIRAVRLTTLGTSSRELTLDMLVKHDLASSFALGADSGQDTFTMKLTDTDDATNMFQAKVVNAVSTLV